MDSSGHQIKDSHRNEEDALIDRNIQNLPPDLIFLISRTIIESAEKIGINDHSIKERESAVRPVYYSTGSNSIYNLENELNHLLLPFLSKLLSYRLRNSALRALSLSCVQAYQNWYPHLLENFRCTPLQILLLYRILKAYPEQGRMIRSLQIRDQPNRELTRAENEVSKGLSLRTSSRSSDYGSASG